MRRDSGACRSSLCQLDNEVRSGQVRQTGVVVVESKSQPPVQALAEKRKRSEKDERLSWRSVQNCILPMIEALYLLRLPMPCH